MAIKQAIVSTDLSTSEVFAEPDTAITVMFFMNGSGAEAQLTVMIKPAADTNPLAVGTHGILKDITIAAGDTYILDTEKLVIGAGDAIHAVADPASPGAIVATISYVAL